MARTPHTSAQLQASFVDRFKAIVSTLEQCVKDVADAEKDEFPGVWIHADTIHNTRLPEVEDWVDTVEKEVKSQLRAFRTGQKNRAQNNVERAAKDTAKSKTKSKSPGKKGA